MCVPVSVPVYMCINMSVSVVFIFILFVLKITYSVIFAFVNMSIKHIMHVSVFVHN